MSQERTSEIKFKIKLDENNVPLAIDWMAEDGNINSRCKAMMVSVWDENESNTLRLDLWTQEMYVEEMRQFFHQTLMTMADTFERATSDTNLAADMREFGHYFAEKTGLKAPEN